MRVSISPTAEVDPVYFPQIEVIGDIANAIWQMKEDISPNRSWNFDRMLGYRTAELEHTDKLAQDARFPALFRDSAAVVLEEVDRLRRMLPAGWRQRSGKCSS